MRPNSNYSDEEQSRAGANAWDTAEQARQKVEAHRYANAEGNVYAPPPSAGQGGGGEFLVAVPAIAPLLYVGVVATRMIDVATKPPTWLIVPIGMAAIAIAVTLVVLILKPLPRPLAAILVSAYFAVCYFGAMAMFTENFYMMVVVAVLAALGGLVACEYLELGSDGTASFKAWFLQFLSIALVALAVQQYLSSPHWRFLRPMVFEAVQQGRELFTKPRVTDLVQVGYPYRVGGGDGCLHEQNPPHRRTRYCFSTADLVFGYDAGEWLAVKVRQGDGSSRPYLFWQRDVREDPKSGYRSK